MSTSGLAAPPGWYPDPWVWGGQRFFDGAGWTGYAVPPPAPWWPVAHPAWKGARFGLPAAGPGSLASPGRRLGARLLDSLVLLPVFALLLGVTLAVAAPHFGPMFPTPTAAPATRATPTPGFVWLYLTFLGVGTATGLVAVAYETVCTVRWGRTLGKRWLGIRPLRTDGRPLGWGRALGRAAAHWASGWFGLLGLLDPLWCLWDGDSQCLHDKVADTVVVNDPAGPPPHPRHDLRAAAAMR